MRASNVVLLRDIRLGQPFCPLIRHALHTVCKTMVQGIVTMTHREKVSLDIDVAMLHTTTNKQIQTINIPYITAYHIVSVLSSFPLLTRA